MKPQLSHLIHLQHECFPQAAKHSGPSETREAQRVSIGHRNPDFRPERFLVTNWVRSRKSLALCRSRFERDAPYLRRACDTPSTCCAPTITHVSHAPEQSLAESPLCVGGLACDFTRKTLAPRQIESVR